MALGGNYFIKEPKPIIGAPKLLFDRLIDDENDDNMVLDRGEVIESIIFEASRILNSRTRPLKDIKRDVQKSPFAHTLPGNFGLGDLRGMDPNNKNHWHKIEKRCREALERFEPRLKDIKVKVSHFSKMDQKLHLTVNAFLNLKEFQGAVNFFTDMDCIWVR